MTYIDTEFGQVWENPIPAPTHKTSGIEKSEWRALFTPIEALIFRDLVINIDGDLSFLPNDAILNNDAAAIGAAGLTYLQVLKLSVAEWNDARVISVADNRVALSTACLEAVGVIGVGRAAVLMQGVPL